RLWTTALTASLGRSIPSKDPLQGLCSPEKWPRAGQTRAMVRLAWENAERRHIISRGGRRCFCVFCVVHPARYGYLNSARRVWHSVKACQGFLNIQAICTVWKTRAVGRGIEERQCSLPHTFATGVICCSAI